MRVAVSFLLLMTLTAVHSLAGQDRDQTRRRLVPTDFYRIQNVGAPRLSPDGEWIAYPLSTPDSAKDRTNTDIYMVSWDGSRRVRLTSSPESESSPEWSPDNRYLSFLSSRANESRGPQLWLMDRQGGEGLQVTDIRGGINDYVWSPDGTRLVLVIRDPDPDSVKADDGKPPKAVEIDQWVFKRDYVGYLDRRRTHLYLFDVATRSLTQLTTGDYDDAWPAWSPDGKTIAFTSKRAPESERTDNWDLYLIEARAGAEPTGLTTEANNEGRGATFSPDGKWIAFLRSGDPKYWAYDNPRVAIVPAAGGAVRVLTEALDRNASEPTWSHDSKQIYFLFDDDRKGILGRVTLATGAIEPISAAEHELSGLSASADRIVVSVSTDVSPPEVAAVEGKTLRRITTHNDSVMSRIDLGRAERFSSTSKDGTVVGSMLYLPPGYRAGQRYPLALHIHGGPFGQDGHAFDFMRRVFAARGYAVLAVNYRGSSGRGEGFSTAIFADWGNKEVVDLLGAVDEAVARGIADPDRLVLGGWSYGGILTNYTIATDTRFKAGVSGAGSSLQIAMYGTDQYVYQYELELGSPWKNLDAWLKVSYPFLKADRIVTPTLFMGGERDFNVPITGSEQMYQALRSNNVETRLVVWPGMFHGPRTPGQRIDMINRYLTWWERYVTPAAP